MSASGVRDVLVVGGGPAGSTLARALAGNGLRVAVLDKARFPRDKTCAGWITPAVVQALGLDLADYGRGRVLQPIHGFRVARMGQPAHESRLGAAPASWGIRRFELDHYLLARSGAEVHQGTPVTSLAREGGNWVVNGTLRAPLLVGAGGHFCPVARAIGADPGRGETVVGAQEFEVPLTPAQAARCRARGDVPSLWFCADLAGYAWVFRKGDWLNVGIGRENPRGLGAHAGAFLDAMVRAGELEAELAATRRAGHAYLLYPHAPRPLVADGALLIGDAAGLAYAESGEGIRPAVESALLAARVVRACDGDYRAQRLAPYPRAIAQRFGPRSRDAGRTRAPAGPLQRGAASLLLRSPWFSREVVVRRWFLREHVPPLRGTVA